MPIAGQELLYDLEPELLRGVPLHVSLGKCGSYWEIPEPWIPWRADLDRRFCYGKPSSFMTFFGWVV